MVWCWSLDEKAELVASEFGKFFMTPHYRGHPTVLVRFQAIDGDERRELLTESWSIRAPNKLVAAFDAEG